MERTFSFFVLFFLFLIPLTPAPTAAGAGVSANDGVLTAVEVDRADGRAERLWYFGQPPLKISLSPEQVAAAGGAAALNGRRVSFQNGRLTKVGQEVPRSPTLTGEVAWATLLVVSPGKKAWFTEEKQRYLRGLLLGQDYPSLPHYWRHVSSGKINLNGSAVYGPYETPKPLAGYLANDGTFDLWQLTVDASGAADPEVDFRRFYGLRLILAENVGCACATVGSAWELNLDGTKKSYAITWLPPWSWEASGLGQWGPTHEDGHGLGFLHSGGVTGATYDNRTDVMSGAICGVGQHPIYGCVGQQPIGWHKSQAGWLSAETVAFGTVRTATLEQSRILRVALGDKDYTIEARFTEDPYDSRLTPGGGVYLHNFVAGRNPEEVGLVASGQPDDSRGGNGRWTVGGRFERDGVTVCVEEKVAESFRVVTGYGISVECRFRYQIYLPSVFR